jgi:uncharacterized protein (TIGR02452 family)
MKRAARKEIAQQTVEIVKRGTYQSASGRTVEIGPAVQRCLDATRYYLPEDIERLRQQVVSRPADQHVAQIEVVNETTLQGIARLLADGGGPVAALNFASAKNPGGGFLNGSQAQEESLARSSALYASLMRAWPFYERNRGSPSLLYSDAMILSPDCPIFRDDDGRLLEESLTAGFITSAAPNAGAAEDSRPEELPAIPDTFRRRSDSILALAAAHGYRRLVLGAWGCGVFRNDPRVVAAAFADHLHHGTWKHRFERVVFSVLDLSPALKTFLAFKTALE